MQIDELPEETQERLAQRAAAAGTTPENLARRLLIWSVGSTEDTD